MEWISVDDRLPSGIGDFLIYGKSGYTAWAFFNSRKHFVDAVHHHTFRDVTHWMPLPQPPKP